MTKKSVGAVTWLDLTVQDAAQIRDFYGEVVGRRPEGADMEGYQDFVMNQPEGGECVAGICHARGPNADLPPVWLVYITVADLEHSVGALPRPGRRDPGRSQGHGRSRPVLRHQGPRRRHFSALRTDLTRIRNSHNGWRSGGPPDERTTAVCPPTQAAGTGPAGSALPDCPR